ncbi:Holliday junction branch migration DNA helicase RuvB [Caldisericum sp. AR60]|uniref:Holliday junction branch migration DNA helicase RuvB n=1 Tax=Caldisericum sp. AR60 TaxID=3397852 RepID=UPI0039FD1A5E
MKSIRPQSIDEFVGQEKVVQSIKIAIQSSKSRNDHLDHILFYGPPGLGKTTLAKIIALELNVSLKYATGPSIEKVSDLAGILINLSPNDILFIDEIHRLPKPVEEVLYSAMEDFKLPIITGSKRSAHTITLNLQPFTLIGATTRFGLISPPLRDRFGMVFHLELYTPEEIMKIILRDAKLLNINITEEGAYEIGKRARGTPRIGIQLLKRVRDYSDVNGFKIINKEVARNAFKSLNIDEYGLNEVDRKYLNILLNNFKGGPAGIEAIATAMGEDRGTIEEIVEPYLIKINFIVRTQKGRIITTAAKEYLGFNSKDSLF